MATDRYQLGTIVSRLRGHLELLNPVRLVATAGELVTEVSVGPPGDPDALTALASTYRSTAERLGRLEATAAATAFTRVATALDTLAAAVRDQQRRHAELHRELRDAWYDVTHVRLFGRDAPLPDPGAADDLLAAVRELVRGCVEVYTDSITASDTAATVFADVAAAARVYVASGLEPVSALLAAAPVPADAGWPDVSMLTPAQLRRAGARLGELSRPELDAVRELRAAAGSAAERGWLLKTLAAGHDLAALRVFADAVRGHDATWLRQHLTLVDRDTTGPQRRGGISVEQYEDTTCGTTSLIVARADADPVFALSLTAGDFAAAFAAARALVHDQTNVLWPERLGTSPAGMAAYLNRHPELGARYGWRMVDDTDRRAVSATLRTVLAAVDHGHPVPVLVADQNLTRGAHYVLLLGHDDGQVLLYNPAHGNSFRLPASDFLTGGLRSVAGFDHAQAVVVPQS